MLRTIKKYNLLAILFVLSISHLYAQQNNQSQQNSVDKDVLETQEKKIDTEETKSNPSPISPKLDQDGSIVQLINQGQQYVNEGNIDSLTIILDHLSSLIQENNVSKNQLYSFYILKSEYHNFRSEYVSELNTLSEAKKIFEPTDISKFTSINRRIARIYSLLSDFKSCLEIYEANLSFLLKAKGTDIDILYTYFGIALCNMELGNYNYTKNVCFQAIELSNKSGITNSMGYIYYLLGTIYIEETKIDSASFFLDKGMSISKKQNDIKELHDIYGSMVNLELLKGNKIKAQHYAEIAIENPSFHDPNLYNNLAQIYSSQQDFQSSNKLLLENIAYYEEVSNENTIYNVVSTLLKNKYDQEKTIQIAQSEQHFQKTKFQIIGFASIILLLGALFIIYNQIVNKRKIEKINEDLIEKNNNLEQFAFICSHDLKEPIRNIGSFSTLLQRKLKKENLTSDYDNYFDSINKGTQVLSKIVNSLKTYTDLNQEIIHTKSNFSLQSLISDTIGSFNQFANEKNAVITFNNQIKDHKIFSSEKGIRLILTNIIENAIKHNLSEERMININASKLNNGIHITIEDNGIGIPNEYFDQIFLPFKTLKNKSLTASSGLGLAICKRIISIIGGKIWLESAVEKGSKFHIVIHQ